MTSQRQARGRTSNVIVLPAHARRRADDDANTYQQTSESSVVNRQDKVHENGPLTGQRLREAGVRAREQVHLLVSTARDAICSRSGRRQAVQWAHEWQLTLTKICILTRGQCFRPSCLRLSGARCWARRRSARRGNGREAASLRPPDTPAPAGAPLDLPPPQVSAGLRRPQ